MLVSLLLDFHLALGFSFVVSMLLGIVFPGDPFMPIYLFPRQHHGGLIVIRCKKRTAVLRAGALTGLVNFVAIIGIDLYQGELLTRGLYDLSAGFLGAVIVSMHRLGDPAVLRDRSSTSPRTSSSSNFWTPTSRCSRNWSTRAPGPTTTASSSGTWPRPPPRPSTRTRSSHGSAPTTTTSGRSRSRSTSSRTSASTRTSTIASCRR